MGWDNPKGARQIKKVKNCLAAWLSYYTFMHSTSNTNFLIKKKKRKKKHDIDVFLKNKLLVS